MEKLELLKTKQYSKEEYSESTAVVSCGENSLIVLSQEKGYIKIVRLQSMKHELTFNINELAGISNGTVKAIVMHPVRENLAFCLVQINTYHLLISFELIAEKTVLTPKLCQKSARLNHDSSWSVSVSCDGKYVAANDKEKVIVFNSFDFSKFHVVDIASNCVTVVLFHPTHPTSLCVADAEGTTFIVDLSKTNSDRRRRRG
ncbi:hypothetical protein ADUPG1_009482 [Aduncisulcus paluster]|uniref:Uncharacterized protein n=1 Tax=Aduncisulcus paluster TaxID=2918883 RepID=A0ABQ5KX02_9EUKA|nr:hypothetical protein ADUPG1_009482 [Aduncisulcus paluster]